MADGMNRRDFLAVIGVTGAGVATAACGGDQPETFLPYVRPPEDVVPGVASYYTTTCRECPAGCGLHVETHEGRATKVEGNPAHPVSRGSTCARGQASVQGLYHPDRYQGPFLVDRTTGSSRREVSWSVAEQQVAQAIRGAGAGGVALLTGAYRGSLATLTDQFAARWAGAGWNTRRWTRPRAT
jgi:anaerobic selenocysteine-containing dehydrogenase